jgi:ankyrin repeat protein
LLESRSPLVNLNELSFGRTLLSISIQNKNLELVRLLIDHGADVNQRDDEGRTALFDCLTTRSATIFLYCLERGADPLMLDYSNTSVLHLAARFGIIDIIERASIPPLLEMIN